MSAPRAEVELVACTVSFVRRVQRGRVVRIPSRRCRTRLVAPAALVLDAAGGTAVRGSLSRRGLVYATGAATGDVLRLQATRAVAAGRYTLTLTWSKRGRHSAHGMVTVP
jgi:hypothetical protein